MQSAFNISQICRISPVCISHVANTPSIFVRLGTTRDCASCDLTYGQRTRWEAAAPPHRDFPPPNRLAERILRGTPTLEALLRLWEGGFLGLPLPLFRINFSVVSIIHYSPCRLNHFVLTSLGCIEPVQSCSPKIQKHVSCRPVRFHPNLGRPEKQLPVIAGGGPWSYRTACPAAIQGIP